MNPDRIEKSIVLRAPRSRVWRALASARDRFRERLFEGAHDAGNFRAGGRPGGTLLTVVESGFEGIPLTRRMEAYRGNEQGWTQQMKAIESYAGQAAQSA